MAGHRDEELPHQVDPERGDQIRRDQAGQGVNQVQLPDDHEGRQHDHLERHHHGRQYQHEHHPPTGEAQPGERVAGQRAQHEVAHHAGHRYGGAVEQPPTELSGTPRLDVVDQLRHPGQPRREPSGVRQRGHAGQQGPQQRGAEHQRGRQQDQVPPPGGRAVVHALSRPVMCHGVVHALPRMDRNAVTGPSSGTWIRQNACTAEAPSIRAASSSSRGTDWSAAR